MYSEWTNFSKQTKSHELFLSNRMIELGC